MSGFRVVCVMPIWTNAALKGTRSAKALSRCSQPSYHGLGHPATVSREQRCSWAKARGSAGTVPSLVRPSWTSWVGALPRDALSEPDTRLGADFRP